MASHRSSRTQADHENFKPGPAQSDDRLVNAVDGASNSECGAVGEAQDPNTDRRVHGDRFHTIFIHLHGDGFHTIVIYRFRDNLVTQS